VQGLVTAVYVIGMASVAYAAHSLSESALWPLLFKQALTIKQMSTYLEASRGSIPSSPFALFAARNFDSTLVLLCTVIITIVPLSSAPLVGYVYDRQNISVGFESQYKQGGGIGPYYVQKNPPISIRDSSVALYSSWESKISSEPMPEYRDWFIDRRSLEARGNMTVEAVQPIQSVTCRAWKPEKPSRKDRHIWFKTKMADNRKRKDEHNHDNKVKIQRRPRLAVWAHDYSFLSPTRTKTMLVFEALNGSIDGGVTTTDLPTSSKVVNMSTIICDVDVEIVNNQLKVGNGGDSATAPVQITSLSHLHVTGYQQRRHSERISPLVHRGSNRQRRKYQWFPAHVRSSHSIER
jgi:hypothetical protein